MRTFFGLLACGLLITSIVLLAYPHGVAHATMMINEISLRGEYPLNILVLSDVNYRIASFISGFFGICFAAAAWKLSMRSTSLERLYMRALSDERDVQIEREDRLVDLAEYKGMYLALQDLFGAGDGTEKMLEEEIGHALVARSDMEHLLQMLDANDSDDLFKRVNVLLLLEKGAANKNGQPSASRIPEYVGGQACEE